MKKHEDYLEFINEWSELPPVAQVRELRETCARLHALLKSGPLAAELAFVLTDERATTNALGVERVIALLDALEEIRAGKLKTAKAGKPGLPPWMWGRARRLVGNSPHPVSRYFPPAFRGRKRGEKKISAVGPLRPGNEFARWFLVEMNRETPGRRAVTAENCEHLLEVILAKRRRVNGSGPARRGRRA